MRTYHNNPLTVSNTKSLKYICGNFTFEALNLHGEKSTLHGEECATRPDTEYRFYRLKVMVRLRYLCFILNIP